MMKNETQTPALRLDIDRMRRNIDRMASAVRDSGCALRPHFKTSKMIEVARAQKAAGAVGFTCATAAEVFALLDAGFDDLFWNQPPVGAVRIEQALRANRRGRVSLALDSLVAARPLSAAAVEAGVTLPCRLEIDTGMARAGVLPEDAAKLASELWALPGLSFEGIFTHEGQLYGITDKAARRKAAIEVGKTMVGIAADLRDLGLGCDVVSVGSTPGGAETAAVDGVTEARPGTYVFMDANQLHLGSCTIEDCAVRVEATVLGRPRPGAAIIDAGLKAMSSDRSLTAHGFGLVEGHANISFDTAFEEHGLLTGEGADSLSVGDRVFIIPNHVCGAVNMHSRVHVTSQGRVVDTWSTTGRH